MDHSVVPFTPIRKQNLPFSALVILIMPHSNNMIYIQNWLFRNSAFIKSNR